MVTRAVAVVTLLLGASALPHAAAHGSSAKSAAPRCVASPAVRKSAKQVIVVRGSSTTSARATVTLLERRSGCLVVAAGPFEAWVGRNGLSAHHREGDGTTPIGVFGIGGEMYGVEPSPGLHFRFHRLRCGDWWDEDPRSAMYNRFVHVTCGTRPLFIGDSEALWEQAPAYDLFAVVAYNAGPIVPGAGSAIFLHRATGGPTNGCVALDDGPLRTVLRALEPADRPEIAISVG